MHRLHGQSLNRFTLIIGEITTERLPYYRRRDKILITDNPDMGCMGYLAILSSTSAVSKFYLPYMIGNIAADIDKLKSGDIVGISDDGKIHVLWSIESSQNSLLLTESCNCRCEMCPQPPGKHDPELFNSALRTLNLLKGKIVNDICLTGGEPTLLGDDFIKILQTCHVDHPDAHVSVLTNAVSFADSKFAAAVAREAKTSDLFCVSLHSDIDIIHDEIVGRKGSYNRTQMGIYNLAKHGMAIEIRHVINKKNYMRLGEFAEHMYRYFPFGSHYAFMAMEVYGFAERNVNEIYIDPYECRDELRKAVLTMSRRKLPTSIYNVPLCLCDKDVRHFLRQSISSWKNEWPIECSQCSCKDKCSGFFSTSAIPFSRYIYPIFRNISISQKLPYSSTVQLQVP